MYKIKEKPEDFVVEEVTNVKPQKYGSYVYFWLKKKGLNTLQAIEYLAKDLRVNLKFINFAGTKDKNAVTTQLVSVKGKGWEQVSKVRIDGVSLLFYGYGDERLHLGDLVGNRFKIKVKNVDVDLLKNRPKKFINYFGEQRLSKYNAAIGKALVKGDFSVAIDLMHKANHYYSKKMDAYLEQKKGDIVGALRVVPKKLLRLYVNAYQSHMWNETVRLYKGKVTSIPLIGFGLEVPDSGLKKVIEKIMKIEEISARDFVIRRLPDLSAEGGVREKYMILKKFKIVRKGSSSCVLSFELGKGSYATEVIRQIFG